MDVLLAQLAEWLEHLSISGLMDHRPYLFTVASVLHYFSLFLLIGTSVLVDLRLIGVAARDTGMAEFAGRLLPWTWGALCMAIFSGFLLFAPDAGTFFQVNFFFIKLTVLACSIAFVALIQWRVRDWDRALAPPVAAKASGFISLLLWLTTLVTALEVSHVAGL